MAYTHIAFLTITLFVSKVFGDCPDGFIKHHGSCYMFFGNLKANWIDAKKYCEAFGADLAIIETAAEQNFIHGYLQRLSKSAFSVGDLWIDGSDLLEEGVWRWVSKDTDVVYSAWAPGNPSNDRNNEHCMEIEIRGADTDWNDDVCEKLNNFICEKESTLSQGQILG